MWSKPAQLTALGAARPLRIAYLLDPENCPHELLDAIFREAYGRWGGRRTLLVPATPDGIDERYGDWLWFYDADVIYSYVHSRTKQSPGCMRSMAQRTSSDMSDFVARAIAILVTIVLTFRSPLFHRCL